MSGAAEWKKSKEVAKLAKKKPKADGKSAGFIDVQVEYESSTLKITVKRMQDLKKMDIMSKADPFAYVYLIRNDKAPDNILVEKGHEKTTTKKNEANPNFMEEFKFAETHVFGIEWSGLQSYMICIAVYDWDRMTADDFMGGIRVPARLMNQAAGRMNVSFKAPLLEHDVDGHPREVELSKINFYGGTHTETMNTASNLTTASVPQPKPSPRPSRKKSTVITGSINIQIEYIRTGTNHLRVFVDRCEKLRDEDLAGKSDPYVKVYVLYNDQKLLDGDKKQTRTIKNDLNPKFEEYFDFKMSEMMLKDSYMVIEVWDDDTFSKDDPIGGVRFSLEHLDISMASTMKLSLFHFVSKELPKIIHLETKVVPVAQFVGRRDSSSSEEEASPPPPVHQDCWMEEANDRFVRYIHHMQILKDAKLSRGRFDNEINVTETVRKSFKRESIVFDQVNISFQDLIQKERLRNQQLLAQRGSLASSLREKEIRISEMEASVARKRQEYASMKSRLTIMETELEYLLRMSKISANGIRIPAVQERGQIPTHVSIHFPGESEKVDHRESTIRITVPIKITDRIRTMLTAHLEEVRRGFVPHFSDWEVEVRQIVTQIKEYEDKIGRLRLYHPDMGNIIAQYRTELGTINGEINVVRQEVNNLITYISGQENEFGHKKSSLSHQFESLYGQLEQSLIKRGSQFGAEHKELMSQLLELEIYNYLLKFEENRIRDAENAASGLGPDGDRASIMMEEIHGDRQVYESTERGTVRASATGYHSSSAYTSERAAYNGGSRRSRSSSSSSSSDEEKESRRQSRSSYTNQSSSTYTVRETGRVITSNTAGVYLAGSSSSRRPSNLVNQAGGMFTGYSGGSVQSVYRGEVANSSKPDRPLREYPSTSGYATTSPGPLSPTTPTGPGPRTPGISTPGSPSFSVGRDSNISDVFTHLRPEIQDNL